VSGKTTRRECLEMLAAGACCSGRALLAAGQEATGLERPALANPDLERPPDHERRMQWWRQARYGMFITWGLFSILGRGEWVMAIEDIPLKEYEKLAEEFNPPPNVARQWARLARESEMKYVLITAKFHDGFCLFDTPTTDYCATRKAAGRDLVREFVDAVRAEGLRIAFYFSLMDWHDPDWAVCKTDLEARSRFVDRVHAELRQLMTNYGKIDVLWYDGAFPLDAEGWRSKEMNAMVFELQPDIVINNRSWMAGDFSTPEQTIVASKGDWESCMTLNEHWGYGAADDNWKPPKTVISNLIHCGVGGGNYLLNIGPRADGSVPVPSVEILKSVGKWLRKNGSSIRGITKSRIESVDGALVAQKGNTVYLYMVSWPGTTLTIGGIDRKPLRATLLVTGQEIAVELRGTRLILSGLPSDPPDDPVTVLALEFDSEPIQNSMATRIFAESSILHSEQMKKGWS